MGTYKYISNTKPVTGWAELDGYDPTGGASLGTITDYVGTGIVTYDGQISGANTRVPSLANNILKFPMGVWNEDYTSTYPYFNSYYTIFKTLNVKINNVTKTWNNTTLTYAQGSSLPIEDLEFDASGWSTVNSFDCTFTGSALPYYDSSTVRFTGSSGGYPDTAPTSYTVTFTCNNYEPDRPSFTYAKEAHVGEKHTITIRAVDTLSGLTYPTTKFYLQTKAKGASSYTSTQISDFTLNTTGYTYTYTVPESLLDGQIRYQLQYSYKSSYGSGTAMTLNTVAIPVSAKLCNTYAISNGVIIPANKIATIQNGVITPADGSLHPIVSGVIT